MAQSTPVRGRRFESRVDQNHHRRIIVVAASVDVTSAARVDVIARVGIIERCGQAAVAHITSAENAAATEATRSARSVS